ATCVATHSVGNDEEVLPLENAHGVLVSLAAESAIRLHCRAHQEERFCVLRLLRHGVRIARELLDRGLDDAALNRNGERQQTNLGRIDVVILLVVELYGLDIWTRLHSLRDRRNDRRRLWQLRGARRPRLNWPRSRLGSGRARRRVTTRHRGIRCPL